MADQELGLRLKTTSDVPEAMNKAKSAVVSFDKQVQDIQKKFSTAFKDIFLGFTAPMVILNSVIGSISGAIEKAKQDAKEGLDLLAKGETAYASSQEKRMAAYFKNKNEIQKEKELVDAGVIESFKQFAKTNDGKAIISSLERNYAEQGDSVGAQLVRSGQFKRLSELDPSFKRIMLDTFMRSPEGRAAIETKQKDFKGPEGFSNVVGVGANPVMEAMSAQLEEARKQTALLEQIAGPARSNQTDFTKPNTESK